MKGKLKAECFWPSIRMSPMDIGPVNLIFRITIFTRDFNAPILIYLSFSCCISNQLALDAGCYCWSNCSTVQVGWWWSEAAFCCTLIDSSVVLCTTNYFGRFDELHFQFIHYSLVIILFIRLFFGLFFSIDYSWLVFLQTGLCLSQHQPFDTPLTFFSLPFKKLSFDMALHWLWHKLHIGLMRHFGNIYWRDSKWKFQRPITSSLPFCSSLETAESSELNSSHWGPFFYIIYHINWMIVRFWVEHKSFRLLYIWSI